MTIQINDEQPIDTWSNEEDSHDSDGSWDLADDFVVFDEDSAD